MPNSSPTSAWRALREGNERFVHGAPMHPSQGIEDRTRLIDGQHPTAVLFGCADSRVAAEIIFDQGLGDMFVVRTAGHTLDFAVIGSIEYAVAVLNVPLIAILGHDSCGAVAATVNTLDTGELPPGYIRDVVERVLSSVLEGRREGLERIDQFEARHVQETASLLSQRSRIISDRIKEGKLAIVCLTYTLADGKVKLHGSMGYLGVDPSQGE